MLAVLALVPAGPAFGAAGEETKGRLEAHLKQLRSEDENAYLVAVEEGLKDESAVIRARTVDEALTRGTAIGNVLVLRYLLDGRTNMTVSLELPDYDREKIDKRARHPPFVQCEEVSVSREGDIKTKCRGSRSTGRLLRSGMNLQITTKCVLDCALVPKKSLPVSMSCTYSCDYHKPVAASVKLE